MPTEPLLHVVLHQPEIPQNTGNIGRSCVAVGAKLWLVRPLGFRLDEKYLRRAGMDYWDTLDWEAIESWDALCERLEGRLPWFIEEGGTRAPWDVELARGDVVVFGAESRGLPRSLLETAPERILSLPMRPGTRSLNLASTVNTILYETVRQVGGV
jgi:tRNA (cytidine/uridine-2'-O-)-methyltransferase